MDTTTASSKRGDVFAGINIAIFVLAVISVTLRCYVRFFMINSHGWDDYFMLGALGSFIANTTVALLSIKYGAGQHIWLLTDEDIIEALKYTYASEITYSATMVLSKISIALFLLRLMPNKIHRLIIYVASSLTCVANLALLFIVTFQCQPLSKAWDKASPGTCISSEAILITTYTYSAFTILTDFTFAILSLYLVWKLQVSLKTKAFLAPVLALAFIASVAVIARIPVIKDFAAPDFLFATNAFAIWSAVEQGLAITSGSLPTIRPFLRKGVDLLRSRKSTASKPPAYAPYNDISGPSRGTKRRDMFSLRAYHANHPQGDEETAHRPSMTSTAHSPIEGERPVTAP